jgi:hypothetical protein
LQDVGILLNEIGVVDTTSADEQKCATKFINSWQKREAVSAVEAGSAALDIVVTNIMTMVGITIATVFQYRPRTEVRIFHSLDL